MFGGDDCVVGGQVGVCCVIWVEGFLFFFRVEIFICVDRLIPLDIVVDILLTACGWSWFAVNMTAARSL